MYMNGAFTVGALCMHARVTNVHLRDLILERHIKLEELLSTLGETLTFSCCVVYLLNNRLIQACDVIIVLPEHGIFTLLNLLKTL